MTTLATIYESNDQFSVSLLFENSTFACEFFRSFASREDAERTIEQTFQNVRIVPHSRMMMELDNIKLFGCRLDDDLIIDDNRFETFYVSDVRLSDDDILDILDNADKNLDAMEKTFDAILPSPLVEDEPGRTH